MTLSLLFRPHHRVSLKAYLAALDARAHIVTASSAPAASVSASSSSATVVGSSA